MCTDDDLAAVAESEAEAVCENPPDVVKRTNSALLNVCCKLILIE